MTTWRTCPWCPEEDNTWPESAFTAAGSGFDYSQTPCNACFTARYPAKWKNCSGCGKRMKTRGKCVPRCRRCRASESGAAPPPVCKTCGRSCVGRLMVGVDCAMCFDRKWRRRNGVNGRQTIGAWRQERRAA